MLSRLFSLTALLPLLAVFLAATGSSHAAHNGHGSLSRRHHLHNRLSSRDVPLPLVSIPQKRTGNTTTTTGGPRKRASCVAKASSSLLGASATSAATKTTSASAKATSAKGAASAGTNGTGSGNKASSGNEVGKPANWPTETQAGAAPAATRTSAADPFLMALSKSYNNADNKLYTEVHTGQMTYYGQGLGACGDTYDDSSFTAAVSKLMYDTWPGAQAGEMNRNPICGPFVTGRKAINQDGLLETVVPGAQFVDIGGDGLLNCDLQSQCHIPLTATVTHGDKSIQVKIVDRCEACAIGDIDLTPTAFAALADMSLGRTSVSWHFNIY